MDFLISLSTSSSLLYGLLLLGIAQTSERLDLMSAAHILHTFEACNSIIWLVLFGKWLEKRATVHCNLMLLQNLNYSFDRVRRLSSTSAFDKARAGTTLAPEADFEVVDSQLLSPGDLYFLHRNEEVPLDSILRWSKSDEIEVSEHLITGESRPVAKRLEEEVLQGSVCMTESVVFEVRRDYASSTFMQLKTIVRDSREIKTS